jgi:gliding motility-associated lipoprotein GldH
MSPKIYLLSFIVFFISCAEGGYVLYDKSKPIGDHSWQLKDKKEYWLEVPTKPTTYKLSLNLRITNDYPYSNLFILFRTLGPQKEFSTRRLEFKLANSAGDWLGSGSGNIFTFRIPITDTLRFRNLGVYKFEIEQNMRDNPLRGVVDIGLRIEKRK